MLVSSRYINRPATPMPSSGVALKCIVYGNHSKHQPSFVAVSCLLYGYFPRAGSQRTPGPSPESLVATHALFLQEVCVLSSYAYSCGASLTPGAPTLQQPRI